MSRASRRVVIGRRPSRHGGGERTLLILRVKDKIELLPEATEQCVVELDRVHALELRDVIGEFFELDGPVVIEPLDGLP